MPRISATAPAVRPISMGKISQPRSGGFQSPLVLHVDLITAAKAAATATGAVMEKQRGRKKYVLSALASVRRRLCRAASPAPNQRSARHEFFEGAVLNLADALFADAEQVADLPQAVGPITGQAEA